MVSLAGLDNTDVAGKEAMIGTAQLAVTVMNNLSSTCQHIGDTLFVVGTEQSQTVLLVQEVSFTRN